VTHGIFDRLEYELDSSDLFLTDGEAIGPFLHPSDEDVRNSRNAYGWWRWIGRTFRPQTYCEIGCRWGYTLAAMLSIGRPLCRLEQYVAVETEQDESAGCLGHIAAKLATYYPRVRFEPHRVNSQTLRSLPGGPFDIVHVDADHHGPAAFRDLRLAWESIRPGGLLAVDDLHQNTARSVDDPAGETGVAVAVSAFLQEIGRPLVWLPSRTALGIVTKPGA
jgi:predicted O-methyltransferase YrrM